MFELGMFVPHLWASVAAHRDPTHRHNSGALLCGKPG